ncbi:hypothetical protein L9F63_009305, partial [Diploptera punctata]
NLVADTKCTSCERSLNYATKMTRMLQSSTCEEQRSVEEYVAENIKWTPIDYFNNKVVCDLIESKRPPGLFCVMDDVCATMHAVSEGVDQDLQKKLTAASGTHQHYQSCKEGFIIHHYAGIVTYNVEGFCDRNRDVLFPDLVELMQSSSNTFLCSLFPDQINSNSKSRPTTAGNKIRTQANKLVDELMKCTPHYIRCIKPNETKRPKDWEELRVKHQVEYLGLKENIRVRRAGFAYRRPFRKFLHRYAILTKETWPAWRGDEKQGIEWIMKSVNMEGSQYQLGKTKVFIKLAEALLFMLEDQRERKYNYYARVIQKAFKKYFARRQHERQKAEAANLLFGKKERRRFSINRNFAGDYIGLDSRPSLQNLVGRREKVEFAEVVKKYDRRFKASRRDLLLTSKAVFLIGREPIKKGPEKGKHIEVIKRKLEFEHISHLSLSTLQDDFVILHMKEDYDSILEVVFKTEFLLLLNKKYHAQVGRDMAVRFSNSLEFRVKKEGWGGGGIRQVKFISSGTGDMVVLKPSGKVLTVGIGQGLPSNTRPVSRSCPKEHNNLSYPEVIGNMLKDKSLSLQKMETLLKDTNYGKIENNTSQNLKPQIKPRPIGASPSRPAPRLPTSAPRGNIRAPPPPSEPAPPNQPTVRPGFRLPALGLFDPAIITPRKSFTNPRPDKSQVSHSYKCGATGTVPTRMPVMPTPSTRTPQRPPQPVLTNEQRNFMQTPQAGIAGVKRASLSQGGAAKPLPGGGKPRPAMKPKPPALPKAKALYDYTAQDLDEISFKEGDIIEIQKEHEGGWWEGRLRGKSGLLPANYIEKL